MTRVILGALHDEGIRVMVDSPKCAPMEHRTASRLLSISLIAATAWWVSGGAVMGQQVDAPGRVEGASELLSLGTSATGTIAEVMVAAGDHVKTGQRLVRIECSNIEHEIQARRSDLAAAEAAYSRVLHGPRPEEINIGIANVNLANARLQEADKSFQRTQQLHEGFTVTRVQIDQAERDARMAAALLDEVRAKLDLLKAGSREEDISESRARRDAAKERVDEAAARLSYCLVDAPVDGVVLSTNVSRGQLVSSTVPVTLLTLVDDSRRRVRAYVDERDIPKLCPSQRVRVTADGVPGIPLDAVLENIGLTAGENPLAANASRQVRQVTLSVPDNQQQIPIGLRVLAQFLPCPPGQRGGGR
jgi:multidrug resistance efflux pump